MSGTVLDPNTLTSAEVADIRRFCGYSMILRPGISDPISEILPLLDANTIFVVRTVYLANLRLLEADLPAMREGLDVDKAAVYTRNANEQAERKLLFRDQRLALCYALGISTGPFFLGVPVTAVFTV